MLYGVGFAEVSKLLSELGADVRSDGFRPAEGVEYFGELVCDFCRVCVGLPWLAISCLWCQTGLCLFHP